MTNKTVHVHFIDGLRAIAVLSVVVYHLNSNLLPCGYAGVDIFFVISGFVVSYSISSYAEAGWGAGKFMNFISFLNFVLFFYFRRLVRIMPVLVVCLIATFLVATLLVPDAWLSHTNTDTGLFAFFGLSNFILYRDANNYFSPLAEFNPFTHTWSLAVEEQFYVAFPILFFLWIKNYRSASFAILIVLAAESFAYNLYFNIHDQNQAFYMIWCRFWELGIGVLLFQYLTIRNRDGNSLGSIGIVSRIFVEIGFVVMIVGLFSVNTIKLPIPSSAVSVLGASAIRLIALSQIEISRLWNLLR